MDDELSDSMDGRCARCGNLPILQHTHDDALDVVCADLKDAMSKGTCPPHLLSDHHSIRVVVLLSTKLHQDTVLAKLVSPVHNRLRCWLPHSLTPTTPHCALDDDFPTHIETKAGSPIGSPSSPVPTDHAGLWPCQVAMAPAAAAAFFPPTLPPNLLSTLGKTSYIRPCTRNLSLLLANRPGLTNQLVNGSSNWYPNPSNMTV